MKKCYKNQTCFFVYSIILFVLFNINLSAQDITLKIHLRGVFESKISLLPLTGTNILNPIAEREGIRNGETAIITVPRDKLPGEFVLRFDYRDKETSTPYPSEKHIIIYNQDLELWVYPPYCNNMDSTYFQKNEKENALYVHFAKESGKQKEKLILLQNFLISYDDTQSNFYQQGIEEYDKRRIAFNQWLTEQIAKQNGLFVSHTFVFQYMPQIAFKGSESDRIQSVLTHYFDGIDFKDTLLINTSGLKEWMNGYVNIYGARAVTEELRDSLFTLAGKRAIEKASLGHPKMYGWMVDYFYNGYESYNIQKGMAMLQTHIDNPRCLTSKKQQIIKRLEGMAKLVAGTQSPDFTLTNAEGIEFNFHAYKGTAKYKLLLFWSADCEHCQQLVNEIKQWYNEAGNKEKLNIIAVSLDDTETEVQKWENTIKTLPGWQQMRANGGVNAPVANDYAILSTPAMFLIDSKSNIIKSTPDSFEKLIKDLEK